MEKRTHVLYSSINGKYYLASFLQKTTPSQQPPTPVHSFHCPWLGTLVRAGIHSSPRWLSLWTIIPFVITVVIYDRVFLVSTLFRCLSRPPPPPPSVSPTSPLNPRLSTLFSLPSPLILSLRYGAPIWVGRPPSTPWSYRRDIRGSIGGNSTMLLRE